MKKQFVKVFIAMVMVLLLLSLPGCEGYTSHYKAVAFVHSNTSKNASMSFLSFEGTMVFKLKCESADETIHYSAGLENGTSKVFYDCNGIRTELLSLDSGDEISEIGGELQEGTVYIIVEMSEKANEGNFSFEIK